MDEVVGCGRKGGWNRLFWLLHTAARRMTAGCAPEGFDFRKGCKNEFLRILVVVPFLAEDYGLEKNKLTSINAAPDDRTAAFI